MILTLDTDVIVHAFLEPKKEVYKEKYEEFLELHNKAEKIFKAVLEGKHKLVIPSIVLVEISAVISRITNDVKEGKTVANAVFNQSNVLYLDQELTNYCMEKAAETKLSGFDVVVLSTSLLSDSVLITNDSRFYNNVKSYHKSIKAYLLKNIDKKTLDELIG